MSQVRDRLVAPSLATVGIVITVGVAVLLVFAGMLAGEAIWDVMKSVKSWGAGA